MKIEFTKKLAGYIHISWNSKENHVSLMFLVKRNFWQLGWVNYFYDGDNWAFGIGPLFIISFYPRITEDVVDV